MKNPFSILFGKPNLTTLEPVGGIGAIYNILKELYITSFSWENLPNSINPRFLELSLFDYGKVAFFRDEVLGLVSLKATQVGPLNVYYEPTKIHAFGGNGYQKTITNFSECIIVYNNFVRDVPQYRILQYATRLWNLEQTIDINVHAQKTPVLIKTSKKQELTVKNLYQQYEDYKPVVVVDEGLDTNSISTVDTKAEFVARDLFDLKKQIWNEALSYIGIENNSAEKNERLTANEVLVSNGLAIASRNSRLKARETSVDRINELFGENIRVKINNESMLESPIKTDNTVSQRGENDE